MTGPDIASGLHDVVRAGVLREFYKLNTRGHTFWVLVPHVGPRVVHDRDDVCDYLDMARVAA